MFLENSRSSEGQPCMICPEYVHWSQDTWKRTDFLDRPLKNMCITVSSYLLVGDFAGGLLTPRTPVKTVGFPVIF